MQLEIMSSLDILIIEDEPMWQRHLAMLITSLGFSCKIASTYLDALQLLSANRPALITLDLALRTDDEGEADWEGWRIAEYAQRQAIPIIIISAHAQANHVSNAFRKYNVLLYFFDKLNFLEHVRAFETMIEEFFDNYGR